MNKLVSKNPVQRFKQGSKIQKLYGGGGLLGKFTDWLHSGEKESQERIKRLQNPTNDTPVTGKIYPLSGGPGDYSQFIKKLQKQYSTTKGTVTKSVINKPVNNYYLKGFENRKAELAQQGKTVRDIQKMLGFTGKDLDGKWGQNTEDAYNVWLNQQKTNQEAPVVEKPADIAAADAAYNKSKDNAVYSFSGKTLPTPDYGYYSPSSYGTLNPRWLKTAGATNIEGFRNLVNNNNQLKQDLLNRYGENWEQHLFNAAGVNANKRHFGRKSRRLINEALQNTVDTLNNNYMDKVRAYDQQYGLYKQGGQLVSRNPVKRFKNRK